MSLLSLSFARVDGNRRMPSVPTNDERMRAYRAATPAQFANQPLSDRIRAAAYARAAMADAAPSTEHYTRSEP